MLGLSRNRYQSDGVSNIILFNRARASVDNKGNPMAIHFQCPGCLVKYSIPEGEGRSEIECPRCETKFKVPVEEPPVLVDGSMNRRTLKSSGKAIELVPTLRRRRIRVRTSTGGENFLAVTILSGFLGLIVGAGIPMLADFIFMAQKSTLLQDKPNELAYAGYESLSPMIYVLSTCVIGGFFVAFAFYQEANAPATFLSGCLGLAIGAGIPMLVDFISLAERQALVETNPEAKTYFGYHPPTLLLYAVPACVLAILFAGSSLYFQSGERHLEASTEHKGKPMAIRLECPGCEMTFCTEALKAGSVLECPGCQSIVIVPA